MAVFLSNNSVGSILDKRETDQNFKANISKSASFENLAKAWDKLKDEINNFVEVGIQPYSFHRGSGSKTVPPKAEPPDMKPDAQGE